LNSASKLEEAILIAVRAHEGQTHVTTGLPYVLHPLRVMNRVRKAGGDEDAMIVAVLHDVFEDTDTSLEGMECKFNSRVVDCLDVLTRKKFVSYESYIHLIGNNKNRDLTVLVKLCDIADNLQLAKEHPLPAARQATLTARYLKAQKYLKSLPR
jgi:(p)ppGpp synthase/HD superfamily hydrolase